VQTTISQRRNRRTQRFPFGVRIAKGIFCPAFYFFIGQQFESPDSREKIVEEAVEEPEEGSQGYQALKDDRFFFWKPVVVKKM
jgi:hypothetical protein